MQLYYSPTSPYVRKVSITAEVTGLADRITLIPSTPHPIDRDRRIVANNPLGKAPTLVTDEGVALFDSRVIVDYLDAHSVLERVLPRGGVEYWRQLTLQALGDGILDAALLIRYERLVRPEAQQYGPWIDGQLAKINDALDVVERAAPSLGEGLTIGNITIVSALGFLDFRLPSLDWRSRHPNAASWFAKMDSKPVVAATRPKAPVAV